MTTLLEENTLGLEKDPTIFPLSLLLLLRLLHIPLMFLLLMLEKITLPDVTFSANAVAPWFGAWEGRFIVDLLHVLGVLGNFLERTVSGPWKISVVFTVLVRTRLTVLIDLVLLAHVVIIAQMLREMIFTLETIDASVFIAMRTGPAFHI